MKVEKLSKEIAAVCERAYQGFVDAEQSPLEKFERFEVGEESCQDPTVTLNPDTVYFYTGEFNEACNCHPEYTHDIRELPVNIVDVGTSQAITDYLLERKRKREAEKEVKREENKKKRAEAAKRKEIADERKQKELYEDLKKKYAPVST